MDNYILEIIKHTTEFIESNLLEPLNLDDISDNVNLSKFHLLRIWKGATSTGLMEYVRRRRIAASLSDLINNQNSIEFISSKYSFGCERTYNRVFKEEFGITPAKWRRHQCPLKILDRFNADFMNCSGEGLIFFNSISVLPLFSIAGMEYVVDIDENMNFKTANLLGVDFFYKFRPMIANPVEKDVYIGFTTVPGDATGYTLYQPSTQVNQDSIIPHSMRIRRVLPHKYGVFKYIGLHRPEDITSETLHDIWEYIFQVWMPTEKFDLREIFHFERIDYSKCSKQYCECNLFFPISLL